MTIPLVKILDRIRRNRGLPYNGLLSALKIRNATMADFLKLKKFPSDTHLERWLVYLEIPENDRKWYHQLNERQQLHFYLFQKYPEVSRQLIIQLADVITLGVAVKEDIGIALTQLTLSEIHVAPREAHNICNELSRLHPKQ